MITEYKQSHGAVLGFEFSGKLDESDYAGITRQVNEAIAAHGKVRLLVHFRDFSGWTPGGFWRDFRFSREHSESVDRFAVVGEESWQQALTELAKPLVKAEVRYFREADEDAAWAWVSSPTA
jgi:hypothetical protein